MLKSNNVLPKMAPLRFYPRRHTGVTLLELLIGMTVLALALSLITAVLSPLFVRSTDPWHQVRAAELGQSIMNEILSRAFDENSSRTASLLRCGEAGALPCTPASELGPDAGESLLTFNDVDDFHQLATESNSLAALLGETLAAQYNNYQVQVQVTYASAAQVSGLTLGADQAKHIQVRITTPSGNTQIFSAYRGNW